MVADTPVVTYKQHTNGPALRHGDCIMTGPAWQGQRAALYGFYRCTQRLLQPLIAGRGGNTVILAGAETHAAPQRNRLRLR